jgi:hypothetical protein
VFDWLVVLKVVIVPSEEAAYDDDVDKLYLVFATVATGNPPTYPELEGARPLG